MTEVSPRVISYPVSFVRDTDLSHTYRDFFFVWTNWTLGLEIFVKSKEKWKPHLLIDLLFLSSKLKRIVN